MLLTNIIARRVQSRAQTRVLPAYTGRAKPVGATFNRQATMKRPEPFTDVQGLPSVKLRVLQSGGVSTDIEFTSKYSGLMMDSDLIDFYRAVGSLSGGAIRLSQGGLSTRMQRRMKHPYAKNGTRQRLGRLRGSGRGVSNLAVVNKQSGNFARAWSTNVENTNRGKRAQLINSSSVAPYLARGTRTMKAHGPFTTVPARELPRLRRLWNQAARRAWARENARLQMEGVVG